MDKTNEMILADVDSYIVVQVKKLLYGQQNSNHEDFDDLEVDELTQRVRIKFWKTLEKSLVLHPYSYVKRVVHSEFIDMKRQQKRLAVLPIDAEEVIDLSSCAVDPADDVIQRMEFQTFLQHLIRMIVDLPPRQQMAMIGWLWEKVDDTVQLRNVLAGYGFELDRMQLPSARVERHAMLASLSVARQKLAKNRERDDVHTIELVGAGSHK
jgi:DNA-directed RNA polymerase specialized sigma24 family protein